MGGWITFKHEQKPEITEAAVWCPLMQCRSKGNISGGKRERRRREPLGGSGGMPPQKILKSRGLEMRSPRAICDLRISRIIYFVYCLSKPMHIESITLATSITKQKTDYLCILKPANVSPFIVIIVSSQFVALPYVC